MDDLSERVLYFYPSCIVRSTRLLVAGVVELICAVWIPGGDSVMPRGSYSSTTVLASSTVIVILCCWRNFNAYFSGQ